MNLNKEAGSLPNDAGSVSEGNNDGEMVSRDTFVKVLDQRKSDQRRLQDLQSKLEQYELKMQDIENSKLAAEGKKDELISNLEKRLQETENRYKGAVSAFGNSVLDKAIEVQLSERNCKDPRAFIDLLPKSDRELLAKNVDDNFQVDPEAITQVIEENAKKRSYLFESKKVIDKDLQFRTTKDPEQEQPKDMSHDEYVEWYKKQKGQ